MTTEQTPAEHASAAAESIRGLNHATLQTGGQSGWEFPSDAYNVIGGLDRAAGYLPQALDQVWGHLARLADAGHINSDNGIPNRDLQAARDALNDAKQAAEALQAALARAHSATSPLSYRD